LTVLPTEFFYQLVPSSQHVTPLSTQPPAEMGTTSMCLGYKRPVHMLTTYHLHMSLL